MSHGPKYSNTAIQKEKQCTPPTKILLEELMSNRVETNELGTVTDVKIIDQLKI